MNENFKFAAVISTFILVLIGMAWAIVNASKKEHEAWLAFKDAHACKVVAEKQGYTRTTVLTTVSGGGKVSVTPYTQVVPDERAWLCDDGITYWRTK